MDDLYFLDNLEQTFDHLNYYHCHQFIHGVFLDTAPGLVQQLLLDHGAAEVVKIQAIWSDVGTLCYRVLKGGSKGRRFPNIP